MSGFQNLRMFAAGLFGLTAGLSMYAASQRQCRPGGWEYYGRPQSSPMWGGHHNHPHWGGGCFGGGSNMFERHPLWGTDRGNCGMPPMFPPQGRDYGCFYMDY